MPVLPSIAIRRATAADRPALERLAALDSASPPAGEVLIAELDGAVGAAVALTGGATIADPFQATAEAVELLRLRARRLRGHHASSRRMQLRRRPALRAA